MGESGYEQRFVALETKIAYQEKLMSDLNEVLLERSRQLDKLQVRVDQLERLVHDGPMENADHETPPHY